MEYTFTYTALQEMLREESNIRLNMEEQLRLFREKLDKERTERERQMK